MSARVLLAFPAAVLACAPARGPGPAAGPARLPAGESRLGLAEGRDALTYVPPGLHPGSPAPLLVFLHGAGGDARRTVPLLRGLADAYGFVVLAPESRGRTWDLVLGEIGPDLDFLQRALDEVKARLPVDRTHVALAGFSDGASYALSVGLRNRDVFSHVIAFSPGFALPPGRPPRPAAFVSHGADDAVLPVAGARDLVARLLGSGCDVVYREFEGGHAIPSGVATDAVRWFLGR
jgi:predicted esterase